MFAELMGGQNNLLHKYTYTREQRERFRDLRKLTHQGVGIQRVSIIGFGRRIADCQDPLITEVIAQMQNSAQMAVVAKDFPRLMETFPCKYRRLE